MADDRRLCDIVIPRTRLNELTYDCAGLAFWPGDCVEVRLRGRKARAVVVGLPVASGVKGIRPVERLVEPGLLDSALLRLADWLADYYCCHRGEALGAILPRGIGGYRTGERAPAGEPPAGPGFDVGLLPARSGRFEAVLRFLDEARERGGGILLLTEAELESRRGELRARFGDDLVEYHSRLGPTGMKRAWRDIRAGRGRVVAGTRSAVFAPLAAPAGIAVLDAHDPVFKEERHPRYHARDVAVVRARAARCPVLLADPLPAVETWHNVTTGQYRLIEP
ncbi:MAG TPA: hypothetical protein ENN51_03915, partial [candidate division WOR-3 bacterium]|nr:hypothetical protein [candidate division WOR-3 bacterium]